MRSVVSHGAVIWVALAGLGACSSDAAIDVADTGRWGDDTAAPNADAGGDSADQADEDTAPPEEEDDFLALRPAQTDVYVFIANPARGTVTRVNVYTLEARTTEVGLDPRVALTTPDYAKAVVFNRGDDTVAVVDATTLETATVEVRDNLNAMVMSPDGAWVALWHDRSAERPDDPAPEGPQSFNEVSLVKLATREHFPMAVDLDPKQIAFTADSGEALVVTDTSLAIVDLSAVTPLPVLVPVAPDPLDPPIAEEVLLSPDGSYALVRQFGAEDIALVDLANRTVSRIPTGQNPTDLDLAPDGVHAVVVARGSAELYVLDLAHPLDAPRVVAVPEALVAGSIAFVPAQEQAILYSTSSLEPRMGIWDLQTDDIEVFPLQKPVDRVHVSPTGETAIVFHPAENPAGMTSASPFYGRFALSLVDLATHRTNSMVLPSEPAGYAASGSGDRGYFIMEGERFLEILDFRTLLYDELTLPSVPVYVGVLPDLAPADSDEPPTWVSQEHPLGRISFYDADTNSLDTMTGFELNSQIEE